MATASLRTTAVKSVFWVAVNQYGSLIISFLINIILTRLLLPTDYGAIGMLAIFIAIASSLVEGGFGTALIQRQDVTKDDYTSVFWINLVISISLYIVLFFCAPLIAKWFDLPILSPVLRLQSIILIINSFNIVQNTQLVKNFEFKKQTIRILLSQIISALIAILLAFNGYGIWALVWQGIVSALANTLLLWHISDWRPEFKINFARLKSLSGFGSMILISSICNTLYTNFQAFIIGRSFSLVDLGFYTQAKKIESVPISGTSSILNVVLFPLYSAVANDSERHLNLVRKNMNVISFLVFPLMLMLAVLARPTVDFLYGEKWMSSVFFLQILCIYGVTFPLNTTSTSIFKSLGQGKVYLILQTVKRIINIIILVACIPFGLHFFLWGLVATGYMSYILNMYYSNKIGYSWFKQLGDIIPSALIAILSSFFTYFFLYKVISIDINLWLIIIGVVVFMGCYMGLTYLINRRSLRLTMEIIRRKNQK